jgi:HEAT repeat protein
MRATPASTDYDGWVRLLAVSGRRPEAKHHLQLSGAPAVPAIRRGLRHRKPIVRRLCVSLLDRLVDDESVPDLVAALDDVDADVRKRALHALACEPCKQNGCRPGDDLFVPRALELLHDPDPDMRAGAINALGNVATRGDRPDVLDALAAVGETDAHPAIRSMARGRVGTG